MDMNCNDTRRKIEQISKELEQINCLDIKFPQGELLCSKNGSRYKWYIKDRNGTSYLPKSNRKLAEILALKNTIIIGKKNWKASFQLVMLIYEK